MEAPGGATPVFCKTRDVGNAYSIDLCQAMAAVVGQARVLGAQKIRGLWRLYTSSEEARLMLLTQGLEVNSVSVQLYSDNPYSHSAGERMDSIKITIKDIPLSYSNADVEAFLKGLGAKLQGQVQYCKARDSNGKLTDYLNGDRFAYADKQQLMSHPLRRFGICGLFECRIYHAGQKDDRVCTNCQKPGHTFYNCKSAEACAVCKEPNHSAGSPACSFYDDQMDVRTVAGKLDPLSNFYMANFSLGEVTFHSAEQAYQYKKALTHGKPDLAKKIMNAGSPYEVKSLARYISCRAEWEGENQQVMQEILQAKFRQVPAARQDLLSTGDQLIVEAVPGQFLWGSGLDAEATAHTRPEGWPGKNMLGEMLMNIRGSSHRQQDTAFPRLPHTVQVGRRSSFKGRRMSGNVSESPNRRRKISSKQKAAADREPSTPHGIRVQYTHDEDLTADSEGEPASDYEAKYAGFGSVK